MGFAKEIVVAFLNPLPICLSVLAVGAGILWFTSSQRTGKVLVTIGIALLLIIGEGHLGYWLLEPLENKYPPFDTAQAGKDMGDPIKYVVVLGGGHVPDPRVSLTGQITTSSLIRLVEGVRIYRAVPGSKLVLSGDSPANVTPEAEAMGRVARILGVDGSDLIVESVASNTASQAQRVKSIVGQARFALVTTADHMPRAVAHFEKQGLHPLPAPTGYVTSKAGEFDLVDLFPMAVSFRATERAMHEYIGMVWGKIRGET